MDVEIDMAGKIMLINQKKHAQLSSAPVGPFRADLGQIILFRSMPYPKAMHAQLSSRVMHSFRQESCAE
jgi:hypothetical protein